MDEKIFFDMFITFNDDKTEAYINIRPNSRIDPENLKESIKQAFIKIKSSLKVSGINYGIISDEEIIEKLKYYCSLDEQKRKSDIFTFVIAKGTPPKNGEDSILIEHVKLKKQTHGTIDEKTGKINHKDLGFSERIVQEGTKIVTIVKPTKGEPGVNVLGEPIEPIPGKLVHKIKYDRKTILEQETPLEINYIAKKEGFIYKDNQKGYFIDERVLTKAVDYKIGNIEGKEVEDSTVVVQGENDIFEDSVKSGFKVEASKIKIKGNVGIEAQVKGKHVEILGVVNKNAVVEGENVKVNKFLGEILKGKIVYLNEISGAKALSEVIIAKNSLSSKLMGSEIIILNEARGSELISDKFIFVNRFCGGAKQKIKIDPYVIPEKENKVKKLKSQLKILKDEYEKVEFNINEVNEKIEKIFPKIEEIINKYIKFSPEKEEKQKKIVINFFAKGKWKDLEEKLKIEFKPEDVYFLKQFHHSSVKKENFLLEKETIEKNISQINKEINEISEVYKKAVIIIKEIKNSIIEVEFEKNIFKLTDDISEPFKSGSPKMEKIDKETKKFLNDYFSNLLTGNSFKIVKKLV